ncbi:MAG: hypothetical protein ACKO2N_05695 [Tabrizicola sp.]
MSRALKQALLLGTFLPLAAVANAQDTGFVQLTFGSIDVTNGYSDRDFIGLNSRFVLSSGTAILLDVTKQDREEKVTSVGVGTEFSTGAGKLRILLEHSDSDIGAAPDWKYAVGYRFNANDSTIYDIELSRARYEGGVSSTSVSGEVVKYFPAMANGSFIVTQLGATLTEPSGSADMGYDVAAVATLVSPGGLNIGAELGFGRISYDLAPLSAVNNDYTAFKPFLSYRVSDNAEVILRGEFVDTDLYDLEGASIGFKLGL